MDEPARCDPGFADRTVGDLLRAQALRAGERTWLLFDERSWSFAEVDRLVDRYASGLRERGADRGSVVATMLENSPRFLFLALALGRLGAIFVPVNLAYRGQSLRHVLEQSSATLLVAEAGLLARVAEVADGLTGLGDILVEDDLRELEQAAPARDIPASAAATLDPWSVMFTSGTTGASKGALMTHQYWYLVPAGLSGPERAVRADDVFLVSSPMFHAAAWLVQIFPSLILGLPVAIERGFSTSRFWERVAHHGATQLLTLAATHLWLYKQEPTPAERDNPARVWAPVPLPQELWEPFRARFGIDHLWSTYGGTEFMAVTASDVREPTKPGSAGRARASVELAVLDDSGRRLPAGSVGELCVRPTVPHAIFQGYIGMPEQTLSRFTDLWFHTGDLVRIDEEGELFFVDRKDDYLRVRGENCSSFEIETGIGAHPAVAEVAAHSVREDGEAALVGEDEIKVCVILKLGMEAGPAELVSFASERLPHFAVPRYVELVEDLPRTPTGRVRKHLLRARGLTEGTWDRGSGRGTAPG